jgi:phosphohistidine phosphatase
VWAPSLVVVAMIVSFAADLVDHALAAAVGADNGSRVRTTWVARRREVRATVACVRRLYLLRHAKSSWDDPDLPDHLRPLARRGRTAVAALVRHMRATGIAPALVLCSPALRARQTWEGVAPGLPAETAVEVDDALYGAGAEDLLRRLRRISADLESVLVVGHNPGLEDLALGLVGHGDPASRRRLETKFPTGALATLDAPGTWHDLGWGTATLIAYAVPREL